MLRILKLLFFTCTERTLWSALKATKTIYSGNRIHNSAVEAKMHMMVMQAFALHVLLTWVKTVHQGQDLAGFYFRWETSSLGWHHPSHQQPGGAQFKWHSFVLWDIWIKNVPGTGDALCVLDRLS